MIASDLSSSLNAAIATADFGAHLVIWGIAVEAIDIIVKLGDHEGFCNWFGDENRFEEMNLKRLKQFSKFFRPWTLAIEIASFALVVYGLSIEVSGSNEAYRISGLQNSVFNKEAADARIIAGQANERAANTESNNLVLQKELQPRRITMEQRTNFIALVQFVPKIPIAINIPTEGFDTEDFALDIRAMLTQAGFKINSDAEFWGINRDPQAIRIHDRDDFATTSNYDITIGISSYDDLYMNLSPVMLTNRDYMNAIFRYPDDLQTDVYSAIGAAFQGIGFNVGWASYRGSNTNQWRVEIRIK